MFQDIKWRAGQLTPEGDLPGVAALLPCGDRTVGAVVAGEDKQLGSCP